MPFLRFARDTRGYENTYVLHGFRGGERTGPRLLYWFRTPPNVRVGRLPLDETAIRAIEESNPELTFDWTKMLQVKAKMPPAPSPGRSSARRPGGSRAAARRSGRPAAAPAPRGKGAGAEEPAAAASGAADIEAADIEAADIEALDIEASDIEAAGIDADDGGPAGADETASRHPVAALVGDDGLARLRARYAELRARVAEKKTTPRARESLEARVEALNPDAWRAGEAVVRAIERFEADVEQLRKTLGRRPRRRSGRAGRGGASRAGTDASRSRGEDASGASTALEGSHEGPQGG